MKTNGRVAFLRDRIGMVALVATVLFACAAYAAEPRLGVGMECLDRDLWDHVPAMPHLKELGIKRVHLLQLRRVLRD